MNLPSEGEIKTSTTAFRERLDKTDASMLWFIWLISLFLIASVLAEPSELEAQQVSFGRTTRRKASESRHTSEVSARQM